MKEKENNVLDTRLVEQLLISDPTDRPLGRTVRGHQQNEDPSAPIVRNTKK